MMMIILLWTAVFLGLPCAYSLFLEEWLSERPEEDVQQAEETHNLKEGVVRHQNVATITYDS